MTDTRRLTITLPADVADRVRERVASGRYANESQVVLQGLLALEDEAADLERWLREEVVPELEAVRADPSLAVSIEDVEAMLEEEYARSIKKAG